MLRKTMSFDDFARRMKTTRLARYLIAGFIIGCIALIAVMLWSTFSASSGVARNAVNALPDESPSKRQTVLQGFSTTRYTDDNQVAFRLKIGKCEIRSSRTRWLNLGVTQVVELSDVQIDLFDWRRAGNPATRPTVADPSEAMNFIKGLSKLYRWESVRGFEINEAIVSLHEESGLATRIETRKLLPDREDRFFLEEGTTITVQPTGRQLTGDRIIWWCKLGIFAVKGRYALQDNGGEHRGEHSLFNLRLEPLNNKNEISEYEKRTQYGTGLNTVQ
jgi:hypothetical protein